VPYVLYVEDNPQDFSLVKKLIERYPDVSLIRGTSAEEGIELIYKLHPKLILLDINLPGINGHEMLAQLKKDKVTQDIPVISVTSEYGFDSSTTYKRAGFDDHLPKPFRMSDFYKLLDRYLGTSR
jgi:CheY-like chemotaxis protein